MHNDTRQLFNGYLEQQGRLNNVGNVATKFSVAPSVQQRLETRIQESSEFLKRVNIVGVREMKGERLGLGIANTIASRTDTSGAAERQTQDPTDLDADGYLCVQTNYDTHVRYAKLDVWAKFPDFQTRIRDAVNQRCALDRMIIGFHGTTAAANTDRAANPLLQDVNLGWLQLLRQRAAQRVMAEGEKQPGKVTYGGKDADYELLDGLVYDAYKNLLDPWNQEDPRLVAIVGRDLLHDKLFPLVEHNDAPTERLAADVVMSQRRLGGLQAIAVPYFPAGTVLVTRLDNLSIYYQLSARRRAVIDNPRRDRVEWYESSNDAYVIEDYGLCALVENIERIEG
jgi:P2 family phage major capsid protein